MSRRAPIVDAAASASGPAASPGSMVRVTYRKSAIGYAHDQKATIVALGLRRLHQTVDHADTPALRGMLHKVRHLVSVQGLAADGPGGAHRAGAGAHAEGAAEPATRRQR